jgi:uncharacterized protein (DUF362 family)
LRALRISFDTCIILPFAKTLDERPGAAFAKINRLGECLDISNEEGKESICFEKMKGLVSQASQSERMACVQRAGNIDLVLSSPKIKTYA